MSEMYVEVPDPYPGRSCWMHIEVPDPHPGRCRNVRSIWQNGRCVTMRCIDYEGTPHVCSFPRPPAKMPSYVSWSLPRPKPWVKPEDGER